MHILVFNNPEQGALPAERGQLSSYCIRDEEIFVSDIILSSTGTRRCR
jgi:hypothetical protein